MPTLDRLSLVSCRRSEINLRFNDVLGVFFPLNHKELKISNEKPWGIGKVACMLFVLVCRLEK